MQNLLFMPLTEAEKGDSSEFMNPHKAQIWGKLQGALNVFGSSIFYSIGGWVERRTKDVFKNSVSCSHYLLSNFTRVVSYYFGLNLGLRPHETQTDTRG